MVDMAGVVVVCIYLNILLYKHKNVYDFEKICGIRAEILAKK